MQQSDMKYCHVCGNFDEYYDEFLEVDHNDTPKHQANLILMNYKANKRLFSKNRDGIIVLCTAECVQFGDYPASTTESSDKHKIRIYSQPKQDVKFSFSIRNDMVADDFLVIGIQLAHPQPQFKMNKNPYVFGKEPHVLCHKSSLKNQVYVEFSAGDIGQYEMPIMFTFYRESLKKNLIIIREMVVMVQKTHVGEPFIKSPYTCEEWGKTQQVIRSTKKGGPEILFKVPPLLKTIIPLGLKESSLEGSNMPPETKAQLTQLIMATREIFEEGPTEKNWKMFFHHLLWWEEVITSVNLKRYNMAGVKLERCGILFKLEVPGLAEKRPSLLRGDRLFIRPQVNTDVAYEGRIHDLNSNSIIISNVDSGFSFYYEPDSLFNVRFLLSRAPLQRMHEAVASVNASRQLPRLYPAPVPVPAPIMQLECFHNPLILENKEQRSAVEHIVSGSSGLAPYIVFGPPGTGKTMTIVEAIVQVVMKEPKHRVLVCTDSNMAADHIALKLLEYNQKLKIEYFIFRANSKSREWSGLPAALHEVSNGTCSDDAFSVSNYHASQYRILVMTLLHSAKYKQKKKKQHKLYISHLFIDEAAQASEPAALVPITGLLSPTGQLVLAGDPMQLGPVVFSREAKSQGLGVSLLERLKTDYPHMYKDDPNYITMLVKNFRSDPDILSLPNELFYENNLEPLAEADALSQISILGLPGGTSAVAFHAVNSMEQRMGDAPSYFNVKEVEMLKRYVHALVIEHKVAQRDIGVIAPYTRQVYKIKEWLKSADYLEVEVGTVESFQGKEKRVIVVSTVRANCRLLDYDAMYGLGFLVDDKRYNVTLTRAKAKLIIIGNPACLSRDVKWRRYIDYCKERDCYFGQETEQLERTASMLVEVSRTRFDRCGLTKELKRRESIEQPSTSDGKKPKQKTNE